MNIKLAAISIFTACWYWSSSINAVATQQLVGRFVDVMTISLALILTSSQLIVGSILSIIIIFVMMNQRLLTIRITAGLAKAMR